MNASIVGYNSSKGAVRLLTKSVAVECAQLNPGIRCNSIHPAAVQTGMAAGLYRHFVDLQLVPDHDAAVAALLGRHPIGKPGEPSDVACGALYSAPDASKWVTGSESVVDGGYTAM